jgi:hypothetical protein
MERNDVYKVIDSERTYQDDRWPGHKHSPVEYLVYMRDYIEEALHRESREDSVTWTATMDSFRKVAALAVACMEEHGAQRRSKY